MRVLTGEIQAEWRVAPTVQPARSIPALSRSCGQSLRNTSEQPSPAAQQQAWAAALVLIAIVLLCAITGRLLSLRTRRQIEKAR